MFSRLLTTLAFALALTACGEPDTLAPNTKRHIVFISLDTVRADHLSCYGYERETSPNIDALAAKGLRFSQVRSHSNNTAPSHMSMFTGVVPPVHGVTHTAGVQASPDLVLATELIAASGRQTAAFADGGFVVDNFGFGRGFDTFTSQLEHVDDKLDTVQSWLDEASDDPTFLFFHTYTAHAPYLPEPSHDIFTDPNYSGPLDERRRAMLSHRMRGMHVAELDVAMDIFWQERQHFDDEDTEYLRALYDGCIRQADAAVGRLVSMLEAKGWLDDTWIVITSDHGEAFREHGTYSHRQLYEEEIHVPLIIVPPGGLAQGEVVDAQAGLIDVGPTLLHIADAESLEGVQGRSLLPVASIVPAPTFAAAGPTFEIRALIDGKHKLVESGGELKFFHLGDDASEQSNLASAAPPWTSALTEEATSIDAANATLREVIGDPVDARDLGEAQARALRALGYVR